jgi:intracellular multiplication protein IcmJ
MIDKNSLKLSINPSGWNLFRRRKADPAFRPIRDKIFNRDSHVCQFCGFQAQEYQEIINLDQNYRNNKFSNMVTACCFCTQCFFIEKVGNAGFGGGKLIYLPEMKQEELNSFCHVIFCAMTNASGYRDTAQMIYRDLKFRVQPIEEKFGVGASSPNVFGQMLVECQSNKEVSVEKEFADFRLLPTYAKFKKQLTDWAASAAEELATK